MNLRLIVKAGATGERIGFPENQEFRADAEGQADAEVAAALPPAGIAQRGAATTVDELLQRRQRAKLGLGPFRRARDFADLPGDLTRVVLDVEARHAANAGAPGEQVFGDGGVVVP